MKALDEYILMALFVLLLKRIHFLVIRLFFSSSPLLLSLLAVCFFHSPPRPSPPLSLILFFHKIYHNIFLTDTTYQNSVRSLDEARVVWEREMETCCNVSGYLCVVCFNQ